MAFNEDSPFVHPSFVDSTCVWYVSILSKWIPRKSQLAPVMQVEGWMCALMRIRDLCLSSASLPVSVGLGSRVLIDFSSPECESLFFVFVCFVFLIGIHARFCALREITGHSRSTFATVSPNSYIAHRHVWLT